MEKEKICPFHKVWVGGMRRYNYRIRKYKGQGSTFQKVGDVAVVT